jgi:FkbM family methyltransferase
MPNFKTITEKLRREGLFSTIILAMLYCSEKYVEKTNKARVNRFIRRQKLAFDKLLKIPVNDYYMFIDAEDEGLSHDLILDRNHEFLATQIMKSLLKKDDILIEIGANIGYYAILESGIASRIIAIEPVARCAEILRKNIVLNGSMNVEVYQIAVGDVDRIVTMHISKRLNWSSIYPSRNVKDVALCPVQAVTLDAFLKEKNICPNVLRMDVEKFEYEIFTAMNRTLEQSSLRVIFVEIHFHLLEKYKSETILKALRSSGFNAVVVIHDIKGGLLNHKFFLPFMRLMWLLRGIENPFGARLTTVDDLLTNEDIIAGHWGALECFFIRPQVPVKES